MKNTGKQATASSTQKQSSSKKTKSANKPTTEGFNLRTDVFNFLGIFITKRQPAVMMENAMEECAL